MAGQDAALKSGAHPHGERLFSASSPGGGDPIKAGKVTPLSPSLAAAKQTKRKKKKKKKDKSPQQTLAEFWTGFQARKPGKITSVFPRRLYKQLQPAAEVLGLRPTESTTGSGSGANTPTSHISLASTSWSAISETPPSPSTSTSTATLPAILGASTTNAAASYETAAQACRAAVARIVHECRRTNEKFTDPDFNLEDDPRLNCLRGLVRRRVADGGEEEALEPCHTPPAVHRVDWIFEKPVFVKGECEEKGGGQSDDKKKEEDKSERSGDKKEDEKSERSKDTKKEDGERSKDKKKGKGERSEDKKKSGFAASDVQQGRLGDCWWIAAVATIAHRTDLMRRVCVARDEACGVYGFVFQRDGGWTPVVVDDNLYLHHDDFATDKYDGSGQRAREHRQRFQRGSEALSFARCEDANETWLPLLEKAFAKAHGDYGALSGGWCGEGVEDLTGGVSTTVLANRVLDKDRLWRELVDGSQEGHFVFGLSVLGCGCYFANHNGLTVNHCYSVLQAVEAPAEEEDDGAATTVRLVKIRNPWGHRSEHTGLGEWHGAWSDGAKEWNAYWFKTLGHTFGDDGVFWMAYEDLLGTFGYLHRTRLFDARWFVVQQWASVGVAWVAAGYLQTRFVVDVKRPGTVVVVLSQLDDRYFRGLRGQYRFALHFVLRRASEKDGGREDRGEILSIVHAPNVHEVRSISCEVDLPTAGRYEVLPQVTGRRNRRKLAEDAVVRETIETNPEKLRQVGRQYDAAHAKGADVVDEDLVLETRRAKRVQRARAKKAWLKAQRRRARDQRFREEMAAWVKGRREEAEGKDKAKAEKMKEEEVEKEKGDEKDGGESSDSSSRIDLGPEPRPVPDPDFDSDSDSANDDDDDDDSDSLLDDSEEDEDEGRGGDDNTARLRKRIGKEDWPFSRDGKNGVDGSDEEDDAGGGHDHAHAHNCDKKTGRDEVSPWNAVCVLGLLVYSQDPATTIELVKPAKKKTKTEEGEAGETTGEASETKSETKSKDC